MALNGGPFFDMWLSKGPAGFDLHQRKATIYDTGNNLACWTPLPVVATAVVNMLRSPNNPKILNRAVFICGVKDVSQNAILAALESEIGKKEEGKKEGREEGKKEEGHKFFSVEHVRLEPIKEAAMKALEKGDWKNATKGLALWFNFKQGVSRSDFWSKVENELVGVRAVELDEAVRAVLAELGDELN